MAMGMAQQLAASLTGNVETALLVIHDYREKAAQLDSALSTAGDMTTSALDVLNKTRVTDTMAALATGTAPTYPTSQDRKFPVQFNPSELTLNADAIPKSETDSTTGRSRTMAVADAKLDLTVRLYFDDMQTYDAFMWDKFTASLTPSGMVSNIAGTVKAVKGETHSVQRQVEALVAALRDP